MAQAPEQGGRGPGAEDVPRRRADPIANVRRTRREVVRAPIKLGRYTLLDRIGRGGFGVVYRALDHLLDLGQVHRVESMNAYVACCDPGHRHATAVFAICDSCETIAELPGERVLRGIANEAKRAGFATRQATVEIKGLCATCASAPEAEADEPA